MTEKSLKDLTNSVVKIAENSPKIQKDVEDIRNAICGSNGIMYVILSLNNAVKSIAKKSGTPLSLGVGSKIVDKTDKVLIKSTDNISKTLTKILLQMQKGGRSTFGGNINNLKIDDRKNNPFGFNAALNVIGRLRDIKLKDFIFTKTKMKHISKIMSSALDMFKNFKDKKEMEQTLNFVENSIDLTKKLSKISIISKPAQWGANAIKKIFFGKGNDGGLLKVFIEMHKHRKEIDYASKQSKKISVVCGSMLLASISLAGIALLGPAALLGAVVTSGIIFVLVGTFKLLSKSIGALMKGAIAFTVLSAGLIAFSLGFGLLRKSTKDMSLKEVGIMSAGIVGTGLAVAGVGLLALPITAGSGVLLLMGASLGLFGLALKAWKDFDSKPIINNIETAVGGLRSIFGLELGKSNETGIVGTAKRIGGGILDFAMSIYDFGKSFFTMGSILLAGAALGVLAKALKPWENWNGSKSIENIGIAVDSLQTAFGLNENKGAGMFKKIASFTGNLFSFAGSIFQMGETFTKMGTLVMATAAMDIIRLTLIPWNKYDSKPAIDNIKNTVDALCDAFGLRTKKQNKGIIRGLMNVVGDLFKTASALTEMGPAFTKLSHLVLATASMDVIRLTLAPWNKYDSKPAMDNISNVINTLGIIISEKTSAIKRNDIRHFKKIASGFKTGMNNFNSGLLLSKYMMNNINNLKGIMNPISSSIKSINSLDIEKASMMKDVFKSFARISNGRPFAGFIKAVDKFADACHDVVESIDNIGNVNNSTTSQAQMTSNVVSNKQSNQTSNMDMKQLADALAEAMKTINVRLDPSMLDVNLVVEGTSGRTFKISLMD